VAAFSLVIYAIALAVRLPDERARSCVEALMEEAEEEKRELGTTPAGH
jgi:hypothetical protein